MLGKLLRDFLGRGAVKGRYDIRAPEEAFRRYEQACACQELGRLDEAEAHYREAISLDPSSPVLCYNLGLLLHGLGDLRGAENCYRRALALKPDDQAVHSSLLCIGDFSSELEREEIYNRHVLWARQFADPLTRSAGTHVNTPDPAKRLRIGYVSADFRRHVTGRFIEPVLRHHNAGRFDVFCYNNHAGTDDMTGHLRSLAAHWRDIHALDDMQLADLIRKDGIDVLIDLSGHSSGNRLLAFARKPAPVQVTWLGYLNTTGMSAMDYRLTDGIADPEGVDHWYRERLLRLPRPQWCYVPDAGPVSARMEGLPVRSEKAPVTFACMARFMKISDAAVDLWIRILISSPEARLRIVDVPAHARSEILRRRLAEAGVADRVDFHPTLPGNAYWEAFMDIDVALDPFPYTGATTTCDCLWMGVPVVTLAGTCGVQRSASSLLSAVGMDELIATSPDGYVAIASALALNKDRIATLRAALRDRMRNSALCDATGFVLHLEEKFLFAWQQWCKVGAQKR